VHEPHGQEKNEDPGEDERLAVIRLDPPVEVDRPEDPREVDEAVQPFPAGKAEAPDGSLGRGQGQRDEGEERGESHHDEGTLGHVLEHGGKIEELIDPEIKGEVERGVEEGEEPEHPPELQRPVDPEEDLSRGAREAREEEDQGPVSEPVQDRADRIRAQVLVQRVPASHEQRRQREREHDRLDPPDHHPGSVRSRALV
jgi:hypothetical protein